MASSVGGLNVEPVGSGVKDYTYRKLALCYKLSRISTLNVLLDSGSPTVESVVLENFDRQLVQLLEQ